jgi:hypothetical protein
MLVCYLCFCLPNPVTSLCHTHTHTHTHTVSRARSLPSGQKFSGPPIRRRRRRGASSSVCVCVILPVPIPRLDTAYYYIYMTCVRRRAAHRRRGAGTFGKKAPPSPLPRRTDDLIPDMRCGKDAACFGLADCSVLGPNSQEEEGERVCRQRRVGIERGK